jgi:tetratricopeptide (TPR) repeat protein
MNEPLQRPDSFYVVGAIGWIELGNFEEATLELDRVSPQNRDHPDVLEALWRVHAARQDWTAALQASRQLVAVAPERPSGWLHQAYAARRAPEGGLETAWQILRPAAEIFPGEGLIAYNLACYACQMQRLDEARDWLQHAFKGKEKAHYRLLALNDEDLKPLWPEIEAM